MDAAALTTGEARRPEDPRLACSTIAGTGATPEMFILLNCNGAIAPLDAREFQEFVAGQVLVLRVAAVIAALAALSVATGILP